MKQKTLSIADIDTFAQTLDGEARNEYERIDSGLAGLIAVGNVIINRRKNPFHWPDTLAEVCREPGEFSCWNFGDPNFIRLQEAPYDEILDTCYGLAEVMSAENSTFPDLTQGSTHYHPRGVQPDWAKHKKPTLILGNHLFYNLAR